MKRRLLIDLDGTLLGVRMAEFVPRMVASMEGHFRPRLDPKLFRAALKAGLKVMAAGSGPTRNLLDAFIEAFSQVSRLPGALAASSFDAFYAGPFRDLRGSAVAVEGTNRVLEAAVGNGWETSLVTNPIFPRQAIETRMEWAGIRDFPFRLITSAELMHHSKPDPAFYREVLKILGAAPNECLMAGNDVVLDMAARSAGITCFLVENGFRAGGEPGAPPDYQGTLDDLAVLLERPPSGARHCVGLVLRAGPDYNGPEFSERNEE